MALECPVLSKPFGRELRLNSLDITLTLQDTEAEISKAIWEALKPQIAKFIKIVYAKSLKWIEDDFREHMLNSGTYEALKENAGLRTELGLPDGGSRFEAIVEKWIENMYTNSICTQDSFEINLVKADYSDVLDMDEAVFNGVSKNPAIGPYTNRWLSWLLLSGNSIVLTTGYGVKYKRPKWSRTDDAIMVKGRTFQIPAQYQGTSNDNVVTNAIESMGSYLEQIITDFAEETEIK